MAQELDSQPHIPGFLSAFNELMRWLLRAGVPVGPFALITIRGRKSGMARTTPVSLVEVGTRRWVHGTMGETNWVRNLRASGAATLTVGGRTESVKAVELSRDEAVAYFRDVLGPRVRRMPLGTWLIGSQLQSHDILEDPRAAAERHPVFELHQAS